MVGRKVLDGTSAKKASRSGKVSESEKRDESESSEEHDFDSATTDARESVESAEDGGKPSS